jgi:hypothetical protein
VVPSSEPLTVLLAKAWTAHTIEIVQTAPTPSCCGPSGHPWGVVTLASVSAGPAVFALFSCIETRYRNVVSAR